MYGAIGGKTRKISKLYGAVSAKIRKIIKVYGVVGKVTKLIYQSELKPDYIWRYMYTYWTNTSWSSGGTRELSYIDDAQQGINFKIIMPTENSGSGRVDTCFSTIWMLEPGESVKIQFSGSISGTISNRNIAYGLIYDTESSKNNVLHCGTDTNGGAITLTNSTDYTIHHVYFIVQMYGSPNGTSYVSGKLYNIYLDTAGVNQLCTWSI